MGAEYNVGSRMNQAESEGHGLRSGSTNLVRAGQCFAARHDAPAFFLKLQILLVRTGS
jgi:hypothetical protein